MPLSKEGLKKIFTTVIIAFGAVYATVFLFGGFDKFEIQISKPVPDRFRNPKQTLISSKFCNGTQISTDKIMS